ncbi:hypothetical protein POM88_010579 [Heracleum sosnowskyi]|uniref:V-type proton ATPase subunit a n=1 Tax=Heracleum sosnowskyi TaxID=360622 RepID=A0AAD8IUP7_9APIA|nr:hypothetical protein POM88_010579 [Heracleum sosnowskyi]
MFLGPTDDLDENQLFSGQKAIQLLLLLLAFVSVPWMLLPKPFLLKLQHNNRQHAQSYVTLADESLQSEINHDSDAQEEFMFSEDFVHQLIHTIEFVLRAVSNTASYTFVCGPSALPILNCLVCSMSGEAEADARRGRSRCRGIATAKERALYLGLVLWLLGSAKRLVKAALQEVARKRETRYSDCRRIEKKVQRHFHDDITVFVLFLNHDLIS